jgi:Tol biopolymer transport system component
MMIGSADAQNTSRLGIFEGTTDVGKVRHAGSTEFRPQSDEYVVTGGGANLWGNTDAFQFAWRRHTGDVGLTAQVRWQGQGGNAHRKAGWMIRQSLDAEAPYVDVMVHGDGLTSLQYRKLPGGSTEELQAPVKSPTAIQLERRGDVFSMSVSTDGKSFLPAQRFSLTLQDPVYVGLAVCAHDDAVTETARFSAVDFKPYGQTQSKNLALESTLETISEQTAERRSVYQARRHFEAPNWSPEGGSLLFNGDGRLYTVPVAGGEPKLLDTGVANRCNNDHGFSPDGKWIALSDQHDGPSRIYVVPSGGGTPRLVTPLGPSYWHGWSPDGRTLTYCAERNGNYDVYTIPVAGGTERRLTTADGLDDGPEYSPDGRYIYFNSERSGLMKIWRMQPDGSDQEPVTSDPDYADWFAHPSPDGRWLLLLSYDKDVKGHPANQDVALRIMPVSGGQPRVLARLFGGQGTINVPSWSPDSRAAAFVSYRLVAR